MFDPLNPPQDIEENKNWRLELLEVDNTKVQAMIQHKCADGIDGFIYFCDAFAWTFDPREKNPHKPFILWPKQIIFAKWMENLYQRSQQGEKHSGVVDKPRGIGATVIVMTWIAWHYIFHEFTARVGSRKEDYVDKKGDPDTLFAKWDYLFDHLPIWMCGKQERAYMMARPAGSLSGNSIVGESANPNFGRGGRKNVIAFDEFGFWNWARSSWESAGEATNFRLAFSTPPETGHDSHQYKLLTQQAGRVSKFEFDWSDDPRRNDEWLNEAKETKSEEEFAREVLKSYEGTTKGKVYAITMRHADIVRRIPYRPELDLFVSWDFGLDTVAIIWWLIDFTTRKVYMIDCYHNANKEIDFYVPFIKGELVSGLNFDYTPAELDQIELHKTWRKEITHYGDPDVKKRNLITKESVRDHLRDKHGIYVQSKPWGGRTWKDMKTKTNLLFRRLIIDELRCEGVLSALRNSRYPERRETSQAQTEPLKPIHDWTSHFRTTVEYFADNEPDTLNVRTQVNSVAQDTKAPTKSPDEVEEERLQKERNKKLGIAEESVRIITQGTDQHNTDPFRPL